ncbi:MAG: FAD-binding oxidoreductase [Chloroflexota bacterium]
MEGITLKTRWNGWGNPGIVMDLPPSAEAFLRERLGEFTPYPDAKLDEILACVPKSRLLSHPRIITDPEERLRHARGQSLPDWVALRSGRIPAFPDGVAYPSTPEDVRFFIGLAQKSNLHLIPYGGGTSVVGHINPQSGNHPVLTLDLRRMNRLIDLDETSRLATFEAGVVGPELEAQLKAHNFTLGHYPQSFEASTLGGWIATRSSGQQSYYYGRIEDLFAGGCIETPRGRVILPPFPASAAGPDLRHLFLGSEGRLGVITQAKIRVRPLPKVEAFFGAFFRDWESGISAVRSAAQAALPLSMMRLSDPQETEVNLQLSGKEKLVRFADQGLRLLRYGSERCLLIYGVCGDQRQALQTKRQAEALFQYYRGLPTGSMIGEMWRKSRFRTPYLRNTLWELGIAIDTLETALPWINVATAAEAIKVAIVEAAAAVGESVVVFSHLSHVYQDGASIYVTFLFRRAPDPDETLERWRAMKIAASQTILANGGTISHQHGVGTDHAVYLEAEKGTRGLALIEAACQALDPEGLLNPGKLLASNTNIRT